MRTVIFFYSFSQFFYSFYHSNSDTKEGLLIARNNRISFESVCSIDTNRKRKRNRKRKNKQDQIRLFSRAYLVNSALLVIPILFKILARCVLIVVIPNESCSAISVRDFPSAINLNTKNSRSDKEL